MNEEKGITLVALVITIIVLLILVGVSLNLVVGEEGIVKKAAETTKIYGIAEEKEKISLGYSAYIIAKESENAPELEVDGARVEKQDDGSWKIFFTNSTNLYLLTSDGEISESTNNHDDQEGEDPETDNTVSSSSSTQMTTPQMTTTTTGNDDFSEDPEM